MKQLLKKLYYTFNYRNALQEYQLQLGYIFHTERIFDQQLFQPLLKYCRDYYELTGSRPICTMMSGVNQQVVDGMKKHGVSDAEFADRMKHLGELSTLGYHGHFWFKPEDHTRYESEIRGNNFNLLAVKSQMQADQDWFKHHGIDTNGIYAAGWWFVNEQLLDLLVQHGYQVDYSFSKSPWFRNQYSHALMNQNDIKTGEPFRLQLPSGELLCIQNLVALHATPFPQDFERNLLKISSPERKNLLAVVNSHDYDLTPRDTINCIRYLQDKYKTRFIGHEELVKQAEKLPLRTVSGKVKTPVYAAG